MKPVTYIDKRTGKNITADLSKNYFKKTAMKVIVSRKNTDVIYKDVMSIEIQDDESVRMVCRDGNVFITNGKCKIIMEANQ